MTNEICDARVKKALDRKGVSEKSRMVNSVSVKMMSLNWMSRKNKCFLDLVEILDRTTNKTILQTAFMNSLVDAFWRIYSKQIIWK